MKQQNVKNEADNEKYLRKFYIIYGLSVAVVISAIITTVSYKFACSVCSIQAVVTDKNDNKIAFKTLYADGSYKDNGTIKIIQFENVGKDKDYYNNIQIGDTLVLSIMDDKLVYNKSSFGKGVFKQDRIRKINGKTLKDIKKIAERDSVLNQMQKVR